MAETIQVTEKMAKFVDWAHEKGEEEIRRLINERLAMLKEECEKNNGYRDSEGFKWDPILEQSERADQWKSGGDCNKCRRLSYCKKQCRANRVLKQVTTPFLYDMYLMDSPEAAMQETAEGLTPEKMLDAMGVEHGKLLN